MWSYPNGHPPGCQFEWLKCERKYEVAKGASAPAKTAGQACTVHFRSGGAIRVGAPDSTRPASGGQCVAGWAEARWPASETATPPHCTGGNGWHRSSNGPPGGYAHLQCLPLRLALALAQLHGNERARRVWLRLPLPGRLVLQELLSAAHKRCPGKAEARWQTPETKERGAWAE
jgi:hypothetical protein